MLQLSSDSLGNFLIGGEILSGFSLFYLFFSVKTGMMVLAFFVALWFQWERQGHFQQAIYKCRPYRVPRGTCTFFFSASLPFTQVKMVLWC